MKLTTNNLRFSRALVAITLLFSVSACSSASDDSSAGMLGSEGDFTSSIPKEAMSHLCPNDGLSAQLVIDEGTPIDLAVDCAAGVVTGEVSDLPEGEYTFTINYFIDGVMVATASTTTNIIAGDTVAVNFDETQLTNVGGNWNEIKWNSGNWS